MNSVRILSVLIIFVAEIVYGDAYAIDAVEFEQLPISKKCDQEFTNYLLFLGARSKKEIGRAYALQYYENVRKTTPKYGIPVDAIRNAYDYPELDDGALLRYASLACKAGEVGYRILPLSEVTNDFMSCKGASNSSECILTVTNKIVGLPVTYRRPRTLNAIHPVRVEPKSKDPILLEALGCELKYPKDSLYNEETGVTTLRVVIDEQGQVLSSSVIKSSGFDRLDQAALEGLRTCTFKPVLRQGVPVKVETTYTYTWQLD